jgi:hypothetical protein
MKIAELLICDSFHKECVFHVASRFASTLSKEIGADMCAIRISLAPSIRETCVYFFFFYFKMVIQLFSDSPFRNPIDFAGKSIHNTCIIIFIHIVMIMHRFQTSFFYIRKDSLGKAFILLVLLFSSISKWWSVATRDGFLSAFRKEWTIGIPDLVNYRGLVTTRIRSFATKIRAIVTNFTE